MLFIWDESKRKANIEKHKLDFIAAGFVYYNPEKITFESIKGNDSKRYIDFAIVNNKLLALIYTYRNENIRIVSFRVASRKERKRYEQQKRENSQLFH